MVDVCLGGNIQINYSKILMKQSILAEEKTRTKKHAKIWQYAAT